MSLHSRLVGFQGPDKNLRTLHYNAYHSLQVAFASLLGEIISLLAQSSIPSLFVSALQSSPTRTLGSQLVVLTGHIVKS